MDQLNEVKGGELIDKRLVAGKPVMGICVGLQVMFELGVEHGIQTEGLGQWRGTVELLDAPLVPHIGWNTVTPFYFVHSYGVQNWQYDGLGPIPSPVPTWAEYGCRFVAAVENGPLTATQFHPEKSGQAGIQLLTNWLKTF
jgi:glutamine amidotransferase